MKLITINIDSTTATVRNLPYEVKIQNNYNVWNSIHTGKFVVLPYQNTVTLDLDDLLYNYKYTGSQSIAPVLNATNNQYEMPTGAATVVTDYYYNQVSVESLDTPTPAFNTVTKYFWFLPTQAFGYDFSMPAGLSIPAITEGLIPRIPANPPAGFYFSTLLFNNSNATINVTYKRDSTVVGTFSVAANKAYHRPLSGATSAYYINDIKVAEVDSCTKPYYLLWIANNGGLQCQPFLKSSTFGMKYVNKTAVDIHNAEWGISKTATGNWKLKSQNLTDNVFKAYGEMFNSPYLVLLDMENNRLHYVNIVNTDYNEKKRTRTDTKPIFFEIELTSADHLRV